MASQTEIDEIINKIYTNIIEIYKDLTLKDFFNCVLKLIECAEEYTNLIGSDKKKIVKGVLILIVNKINFSNPKEKEMILFVLTSSILDILIDTFVGILNKKKPKDVPVQVISPKL